MDRRAQKRVYYATRLSVATPSIDGVLDDACWKTGVWAGDFTQWIPNEGAKPTYPTQLKVLYDDKNLYVAIRAFDGEPGKISEKSGRRDEFIGDATGICLDSYHDHRTGFEFDITAGGQKIDIVLTNPMNADASWNAVWNAKSGREDSAWTAEFEIPLSQLRYSSDTEQVWGMHCWRWIDRLQEESDWEPQSSQGPGILYLFGELRGINNLPTSRRIEIMPYLLGSLKTFKAESGNPFADQGRSFRGNAGLDAKIGLSSNVTADFSINPDFGQVEADPSVMNLSAFETFFDEKRPFFLEGKSIFQFDVDDASLFYSRRIGSASGYTPSAGPNEYMDFPGNPAILEAVKLSGKTSGGLSLGVLQSLTEHEQRKLESPLGSRSVSVSPLTNYVVARVQQDYNEGNSIVGGIVTAVNRFIRDPHLEFMNRNAYTGGLDVLHQWNDKEYFVEAKLTGSAIDGSREAIGNLQTSSARYYQNPDATLERFDSTRTQLTGHGGRLKIGKGSKGLWRYSTELTWRSPGLDLNDLGFMQTADVIRHRLNLSYFVTQPVSIFRTYTISVNQFNNWDFGFRHSSSGGGASLYLEFLNRWAVSTSVSYTSEALDARILRGGESMLLPAAWAASLSARTDQSLKLAFDVNANASSAKYESARSVFIQPGVMFMPLNNLKFSMSVSYSDNHDRLQYVDTKSVDGKNLSILASLHQQTVGATFRIDYNITPEVSLQYYGSPFASVGAYSDFKNVTHARADNYDERFSLLETESAGTQINAKTTGSAPSAFSFGNPDFTFSQFHSNLVFRWEYRPGSQLYFVWSDEMTSYLNPRRSAIDDALGRFTDVHPNGIFMVKFNYWFSL
ncbi:MAG TPA: DUF5916 domain-containing protein [Bacteroidota bacterium]|nr:DUF5916 domain-containing protein [Bacteroidota bacterium]